MDNIVLNGGIISDIKKTLTDELLAKIANNGTSIPYINFKQVWNWCGIEYNSDNGLSQKYNDIQKRFLCNFKPDIDFKINTIPPYKKIDNIFITLPLVLTYCNKYPDIYKFLCYINNKRYLALWNDDLKKIKKFNDIINSRTESVITRKQRKNYMLIQELAENGARLDELKRNKGVVHMTPDEYNKIIVRCGFDYNIIQVHKSGQITVKTDNTQKYLDTDLIIYFIPGLQRIKQAIAKLKELTRPGLPVLTQTQIFNIIRQATF